MLMNVEVEIDRDEILDEMTDDELIAVLHVRGLPVVKPRLSSTCALKATACRKRYEIYVPRCVNPCGNYNTIGEAALALCNALIVGETGFVVCGNAIVFQFTRPQTHTIPLPTLPTFPYPMVPDGTYCGVCENTKASTHVSAI